MPIWLFHPDLDTTRFLSEANPPLLNERQLREAEEAAGVGPATAADPILLPGDSPAAQLRISADSFAPDFLRVGSFDFASARLRDALAQPADVVQYLPADTSRSHADVQAQDYRRMRLLRRQPVVDMAASDVTMRDIPRAGPDADPIRIPYFRRMAVHEDAAPRYEIFTDTVATARWFCTDALALRVLEAGCTGIDFIAPESYTLFGAKMIRTLDGVVPRDPDSPPGQLR